MFMDRKIHYCQDVNSSQLDLEIQCNSNQNPSKLRKLSCGYQQNDSEVYMENQKTQKSQNTTEEQQSWRTDTVQLQNLL